MESEYYDPKEALRYDNETDGYVTLIWQLIQEIQDANIEIISLRYLLSNYMTDRGKECMRMDILDGLYPFCAIDYDGLDCFARKNNNGVNPFNDRSYWTRLKKAGEGKKIDGHPNIYLPNLKGFKRYVYVEIKEK